MRRVRLGFLLAGAAGLMLAGCGGDDDTADAGAAGSAAEDRPTVVVTTNILGDVVGAFAGDELEVVTIMPVGADPHTFQASAQQANQMREADALIVNGAGFEEGLLDVIDAATDDGVATFEAMSAVEAIEYGEGGHDHAEDDHAEDDHAEDDHAEDDHAEDDHADEGEDHAEGDEDGHDHEGEDPHFFTDPARMARSVDAIAAFLIDNVDGVDGEALRASADDYVAELETLDEDVAEILSDIPDEQRVLVTNHEVFGYFADRYDFEVVGTVIPSGSTADGASAGELAELAEVIHDEGVPAIFADNSTSDDLAETLAAEVGEVEVVELFTGSLGDEGSDGATYVAMVRTNAERIADALA
ncbi:MAG: metal ABC transporter substrate-binding protein [Actinomycetota bacterium]|nr:metal ABC transporter substrate-binding protein [Actinomycetota bacterium]